MTHTQKKYTFIILTICLFFSISSQASLPRNLSTNDIGRIIEKLSLPATTRLHRSAEALKAWPGIKFGFEMSFSASGNVNTLGDSTGSISGISFVPRLYFAKGLLPGLEFVLNFLPISSDNALSTTGAALKWQVMDEKEYVIASAVYAAITKTSGFGGLKATHIELGGMISRDLVKYRPYGGVGVIFANGSVLPGFEATSTKGSVNSIHTFAGVEIELPVNISFQLDAMNLSLSFSTFIGKKF